MVVVDMAARKVMEASFGPPIGTCFCPPPSHPYATVGNRTVAVALKLYSNPTTHASEHYLWLRFFDADTNQTLKHISFFLTITKQDQPLFRDLLHTHTGVLDMNVIPTNNTTWTVQGDREPILNGWVPPNATAP